MPHGAVAKVTYHSSTLKKFRRMHVYTPPGYEKGQGEYPVFYLLHGAGDCDDSWTSVGRAGVILDNLIAAGKARPMIVVMPAGHTGQFRFGGGGGDSFQKQMDEFAQDFANDVRPYIEKNYRVKADRASRAIAGLSMGGAPDAERRVRQAVRLRLHRRLQLRHLRHRRGLRRRAARTPSGKTRTRRRWTTPPSRRA